MQAKRGICYPQGKDDLRPPEEYAALLRELSSIGNNINQLAHWANARGSVREEEIAKAAELVREAWRTVKDGL